MRATFDKLLTHLRPEPRPGAYYAGSDRMLVPLPDGSFIRCVASDLSLTPELVCHGIYDRPFWNFLHQTIKPGDRVADIGANIGLFTLAMARLVGPDGHVTAYEPDALMAQLVRENVQMNWVATQTEVVEAAAGARSGQVTFQRHPQFLGSSSAGDADLSRHGVSEGYESVTVPIERPDERLTGPLRLVKIDVEGGEADVIDGLAGVLDQVEFLDVEVVRQNAHDWMGLVERLQHLRDLGGVPHVIAWDGALEPVELNRVIARADYPHVVFRLGLRPTGS